MQIPAWRAAGLSERQAAAHLLDRFTFGPRPGDVERVVAKGLEAWLTEQLARAAPEQGLAARLAPYSSITLPLADQLRLYPDPVRVVREAQQAGVLPAGSSPREAQGSDRRDLRRAVLDYGRSKGYRPQRDLLFDLMSQKVLRAVYAENQLAEVAVDFWYNHLYVSLADNTVRSYVSAYERDAIRPHVFGSFRALLGATARHPAMLLYLDNAQSTANEGQGTTMDERTARSLGRDAGAGFGRRGRGQGRRGGFGGGAAAAPERARNRPRGLNENYARELLELHTLGVDGGYAQADVVEVARAFTGWTVVPARGGADVARRIERVKRGGSLGFRVEGSFLFRADAHDAEPKAVLGVKLPRGRGIEDGDDVLDLVAKHAATARHLATKLARRFAADEPPASLVATLASTFTSSGGDLEAVLRALFAAPEFWAPAVRRAKIKSPFELTVSALRATGADLQQTPALLEWIARLGQPLYLYQAPTGYPDRADAWVNTGALLSRMNFGLELAAGRVAGARLDLAALTGGREPASRSEALATYFALLLPERDASATLADLAPIIEAPEFANQVAAALPAPGKDEARFSELLGSDEQEPYGRLLRGRPQGRIDHAPPTPLEQVVGVLLGSPEFQRR